LQAGENQLVVTVVAADGETTASYTVTLVVALSSDTSLSKFTVNGEDVEDGSEITLPPYTESVDVVAIAGDENAEIEISGFDALQPGDNSPTVTVTAPDGTVQVYTIAITVELSSETGVSEILVDGKPVQDGDVVRTTDTQMTEVDVEVTTIDGNATVEISGNTELLVGDNEISITVTAPNGDSRSYTVIFRVGGLSGNAKLSNLSVNGQAIDLAVKTTTISVIAGTRFVPVSASAEDSAASIIVSGNKNLVEGVNTVTVRVTAADAKTIRLYQVKVVVVAISRNANLKSLSVNGSLVSAGDTITVVAGAKFALPLAVAEDADALVSYSGFRDLKIGNNVATVKVTAPGGNSSSYSVTLLLPSISNDTTLKKFTIDGTSALARSKITVYSGTRKLKVIAIANNAGASVSIKGKDILPGSNTLTVTVTAADGTVAKYIVIVKVRA
jgi:hypothetical protein